MSKRLRIDDMRAVANTPAVLLLPATMPYRADPLATINGFAVYAAPEYADRYRVAMHEIPPLALSIVDIPNAKYLLNEIRRVDLDRQVLARGTRFERYSRRQEARAGGRRNARPVPIEQRWEAHVFAEQGVDARTIERAAALCAVLVARSWRHGSAEDWARRALSLRQRADRKMNKS